MGGGKAGIQASGGERIVRLGRGFDGGERGEEVRRLELRAVSRRNYAGVLYYQNINTHLHVTVRFAPQVGFSRETGAISCRVVQNPPPPFFRNSAPHVYPPPPPPTTAYTTRCFPPTTKRKKRMRPPPKTPTSPPPVIHQPNLSRFSLTLSDARHPAILEYQLTRRGCRVALNLTHTYVPPNLRRRGIAARLVRFACAYARRNGWVVIPTCSYIPVYLERNPHDWDVVVKE